jgi:hypothetical protein
LRQQTDVAVRDPEADGLPDVTLRRISSRRIFEISVLTTLTA